MNNNRFMSSSNAQATQIDLGLRSYMLGVYNHMTTALALTGLMAMGLNFLAISNGALTPIGELFFLSPLKWVVMLAPLGMVFYISAKLNSISAEKARNLFYIYAGLMGLSLSSLLLIYTGASVVKAFFVTAAAFAASAAAQLRASTFEIEEQEWMDAFRNWIVAVRVRRGEAKVSRNNLALRGIGSRSFGR